MNIVAFLAFSALGNLQFIENMFVDQTWSFTKIIPFVILEYIGQGKEWSHGWVFFVSKLLKIYVTKIVRTGEETLSCGYSRGLIN